MKKKLTKIFAITTLITLLFAASGDITKSLVIDIPSADITNTEIGWGCGVGSGI